MPVEGWLAKTAKTVNRQKVNTPDGPSPTRIRDPAPGSEQQGALYCRSHRSSVSLHGELSLSTVRTCPNQGGVYSQPTRSMLTARQPPVRRNCTNCTGTTCPTTRADCTALARLRQGPRLTRPRPLPLSFSHFFPSSQLVRPTPS